jgi:hypothetical protein
MDLFPELITHIRGFLPDSLNVCLVSKTFNEERSKKGKVIKTRLKVPEFNLEWAYAEIMSSGSPKYYHMLALLKAVAFQRDLPFCLRVLDENPELITIETAVDIACTQGFLELLQAAFPRRTTLERQRRILSESQLAAFYGHLEILKWLSENGYHVFTTSHLNDAIEGNHLETIRWLREHGTPWGDFTMSFAIRGNCLDIIKWIRKHGCPWSWNTTRLAIELGNLDILQWVLSDGCPWSHGSLLIARNNRYKRPDILVWITRHVNQVGILFMNRAEPQLEIERRVREAESLESAVKVFRDLVGTREDLWL